MGFVTDAVNRAGSAAVPVARSARQTTKTAGATLPKPSEETPQAAPLATTSYAQELEPLQAAVTEAEQGVSKLVPNTPVSSGFYGPGATALALASGAYSPRRPWEQAPLGWMGSGIESKEQWRQEHAVDAAQKKLQEATAALAAARLTAEPKPAHFELGPFSGGEISKPPAVAGLPGTKLQAPLPISTDPSEAPSKVQRAFSDYLASTGRGRGLDAEQMSEEFVNFRLSRAKERLFDPNPGKDNHSMVTLHNQIKIMNAEISKAEEDLKALGPTTDMPISFGRTAKAAETTAAALKALQIDRDRAVALYDQMARIAQTQIGMDLKAISESRKDAIKAAEQGVSLEVYQAKVAAERAEAEKAKAAKARAEASQ